MTYRAASPSPTRLAFAARCDTGPSRVSNEDSFLIADLATGDCLRRAPADLSLEGTGGFVLAVIDRSGGSGAGAAGEHFDAVVAHAVVGELSRDALPDDDRACGERLRDAVGAAHRAAVELTRGGPLAYTGAAVTVALVRGRRLHTAQLGDTRAYLRRAGALEQITRDDSLANAARDEGLAEERVAEIAMNHPTVITKVLAIGNPEAAVRVVDLRAGDVLLVCSDGLHRMVDDAGIDGILAAAASPSSAADALMNAAVEAGGRDNITILVARVE